MNGNYEWQQHETKQRIQKRMQESHQHRMSKQTSVTPRQVSPQGIIRLPLRLVTAVFNLFR